MGMAKPPSEMQREKTRVTAAAGAGPSSAVVVDTTPEPIQALRRVLRGVWWDYMKRQLDLIQMASGSDRQWEVARTQSLNLINEGEEVLIQAAYQALGVTPPPVGRPIKKA